MSDLRFRCLIDNDFYDAAPFKPYVEKGSAKIGFVLIAFNEDELDKIRNIFKESVRQGQESSLKRIQLEGSDGYLYILSQTSVEKKEKMPYSIMRAYRYYKGYKKKQNKAAVHIKKELDRNCGIRKVSGGKFSAYKYNDKENDMCFPFRLRTSKEANKPLFILFHGAGAMGNDNKKQLFDNIPLLKPLLKEDCNILLPQAPFGSNRGGDAMRNYVKSIKKLVDELKTDFDRKRIYIAGTSFGGCCVWYLAYLFPEYFAAAVPVMGRLCLDDDFEEYDVQRLTKTPIWAAHSSDDTNVRIDSDDYYIAELKKLGADIKYTRWDRYGHSMSGKFYRTEKWAEWCLGKELK